MMFCCSNSDLFSEWRKIVSNHIELTLQNVDYFGTEFRVIFKNEAFTIWHSHNTN